MDTIRILIVDDVEANLISLEYLLYDYFEGIEVIKADGGEEALRIALKERIDFIILDIQMPGMDGFEVAKFLKLNKKTQEIPIIFLTAAFKEEEFQKRGFEVGAVDYLTKPINNHQLINKLRLYIEVFRKNRELTEVNATLSTLLEEKRKQKEVLQSILDTDKNLVLVTNFKDTFILNKSMLEFLGIESVAMFEEKYGCLVDHLQDDEYLLHLETKEEGWGCKEKFQKLYEVVSQSDESHKVVAIENSAGVKRTFVINISEIVPDEDFYLLVLTDITKMQDHHAQTRKQAFYDNLTGIYNRNKLNELLQMEIKRAERSDRPFSCIMFDIDHFKRVNDTYGHLVGDEVLKTIATTIKKRIRQTDHFARWGGEEFILVLTDTVWEQAQVMAEEIRTMVEHIVHERAGRVTISLGVTEYVRGDTIASLVERCDTALYEAKASGRNRVVVAR